MWFMSVQFFIMRGVCPHCLLIDLCGLLMAFLILKNAPLARPEKLPQDAVGSISINKASLLKTGAFALIALGLFIGLHAGFKGAGKKLPVYVRHKTIDPNKGLMMGGLPVNVDNTARLRLIIKTTLMHSVETGQVDPVRPPALVYVQE